MTKSKGVGRLSGLTARPAQYVSHGRRRIWHQHSNELVKRLTEAYTSLDDINFEKITNALKKMLKEPK